MNPTLLLVPLLGLGVGMATAYGVQNRQRRLHFVERDDLDEEIDELGVEVTHDEVCMECGEEIKQGEVGALVKENGHYRPICTNSVCLDTYDLD
jgi:hypothetical protein